MKKKELVTPSGTATFMKLKIQARKTGRDVHAVALRFALERFLARVFSKESTLVFNPDAKTSYDRDKITVKGGMIMCLAEDKNPLEGRATSDADLHVPDFGGSIEDFRDLVKDLLQHDPAVGDDGIRFHVDDIAVAREKDGEKTGGTVTIPLQIGDLFLKIKSDVTFDSRPMHKDAPVVEYPSVLPDMGLGPIHIRRTPWEYVLADKVCAMISLGEANYRIRDYNDVYVILKNGLVDLEKAADIMTANADFKRLQLPAEAEGMPALSEAFVQRQTRRWEQEGPQKNFSAPESLSETVSYIRTELTGILERASGKAALSPA